MRSFFIFYFDAASMCLSSSENVRRVKSAFWDCCDKKHIKMYTVIKKLTEDFWICE